MGIYYSAGSLIREHNRGNSLDCCLQPSFTPDKFEMQVLVKMTHISLNTAYHKSFRCFVCRFCNSLDSLVEMNENHNSKGQNLKKKKEKLEAKMQKVLNILHYITWIFKMLCLCILFSFSFNNSALNYVSVVEANSNIVSQVIFSFWLLLFFFLILLHTESNACTLM